MWMTLRLLLTAGCVALTLPASSQGQPGITGVEPVPLVSGVNRVARFGPDGREAIITLGWRDNGNAWGYSLYQVLLLDRPGGRAWGVVGFELPDGSLEDTIRDSPHTGEDTIRSVRFARGLVDGRPATLLLIATRQWEGAVPDPAPVLVEAFQLGAGGRLGRTKDYFARIFHVQLERRYCNSEVALSQVFGLPLRSSYEGPRTVDGC